MARPKGKAPARSPKRCAYQHGTERCYKWVVGNGEFCSQHAVALSPEEAAEVNALGAEASAALREELGVPPVEMKVMTQETAPREAVRKEQPRPEKTVYPEAAVKDPIRYAMNLALEQVAEEYARDRDERMNARTPGQRMSAVDRARMTLAAYMPQLDDAAAMRGENGEELVEAGWIPRWVRDKDEDGRPNTRRYRMFISMGCKDVLDTTGRPLIGRLGRAIQMPPEVYAARVLQQSPSGAFDTSPYVQSAIDMAEYTNRKMGRTVVDVRPTADHGGHRGYG